MVNNERMDSFFELNVFDKIYNVRLAISTEKHKRLKDYGDCNLYIHLKTEENTINSKVFEQFEEIFEDLRDKKERKKKKYANLIFKVCIPLRRYNEELKREESFEVYIRRTYDNSGKPDYKDLSLNFLIELIERLLDYMDYELGVNLPQINNFSEEYVPKLTEEKTFDDDESFDDFEENSKEEKSFSNLFDSAKQVQSDIEKNNYEVELKDSNVSHPIFKNEQSETNSKNLKVGAVDDFEYEGQKTFGLVVEESNEAESHQEEQLEQLITQSETHDNQQENVFNSFAEDSDDKVDDEEQRKQDLIDLSNRFNKDFSQKVDLNNKSIEIPDFDPDEENSIKDENEEEGVGEETESDDEGFWKQI